nr:MAG TPA: hypothetical protein [Bacteriophage sp.]
MPAPKNIIIAPNTIKKLLICIHLSHVVYITVIVPCISPNYHIL